MCLGYTPCINGHDASAPFRGDPSIVQPKGSEASCLPQPLYQQVVPWNPNFLSVYTWIGQGDEPSFDSTQVQAPQKVFHWGSSPNL